MSLLEEIRMTIEEGHPKTTECLVKEALAQGYSAQTILDHALVTAMRNVGNAYKNNDVFIARILAAARSMRCGLEVLRPYLRGEDEKGLGKIILGTVEGDLHDVGKNLVKIMFESAGFEVIDLGVDVSEKKFKKAIKEHPEASIICISSLLTTTMPEMRHIVASIKKMDRENRLRIMIGGAPITQKFADDIGADYYTEDAWEAAELAKSFVKGRCV